VNAPRVKKTCSRFLVRLYRNLYVRVDASTVCRYKNENPTRCVRNAYIITVAIAIVVIYIPSPNLSPFPPLLPVTPSPRRHRPLPLSIWYTMWDDRYRGEKRIIQICPFLFVFINRSRQHHNNVLFVVVCQPVIIYATCITLSAVIYIYVQ
jgi:hypothetical protein